MYQGTKRKNVKELISEAFIEMLKKKLYIDITVSELVEEANVSRASFYRNYNSIDDVIIYIIDDIYIGLTDKLTPSMFLYRQDKWFEAMVRLFQYILENKNRFFEIQSENASYMIYRLRKKYEFKLQENDGNRMDGYLISVLIGIVYTVADRWRKKNYYESPQTMAQITMKFIDPIIQVADSTYI